jgi:hypothetical protein
LRRQRYTGSQIAVEVGVSPATVSRIGRLSRAHRLRYRSLGVIAMTFAKTIELAKALAWPAVMGWGLWYFRAPVTALIPRVSKVGPVSIEPQTQAAVRPPDPTTEDNAFKRLENMMPPELLAESRALVEQTVPRSATGEKLNEAQYLTRLAATLTLAGLFERTNGTIWGSQLSLLQQANSAPQSLENAHAIYAQAAAAFPHVYGNYTFEQWLDFLTSSVLITKPEDGKIAITVRGRGFLSYLVHHGYHLVRPY